MATFKDLLSVDLVLLHLLPYLPISSILNLASTCKTTQAVIYGTPGAFRRVDLSSCKAAALTSLSVPIDRGGEVWRAERMDESMTEDDFYGGPMRGILSKFRRRNVLQDVHTLILDRQFVTADILNDIICGDEYRIRLLSLLEVMQLNVNKLQQTLRYACRPSRPEGRPYLKGVYFFSDASSLFDQDMTALHEFDQQNMGVTVSAGAQLGAQLNQRSRAQLYGIVPHPYYRMIGGKQNFFRALGWEATLDVCKDTIAFDAVLCRGPRHNPALGGIAGPAIASVYLSPSGCENCGKIPEGPAYAGKSSIGDVPLLRPVPLHSSSVRTAQLLPYDSIPHERTAFFARCKDCVSERLCEGCNRFWCEDCYTLKSSQQIPPIPVPSNDPQQGAHTVGAVNSDIKVHMGFCVESCLVSELYHSVGGGGMWG